MVMPGMSCVIGFAGAGACFVEAFVATGCFVVALRAAVLFRVVFFVAPLGLAAADAAE